MYLRLLSDFADGLRANSMAVAELLQLRDRSFVFFADAQQLNAWCTRLSELIHSAEPCAQFAGAALLRETVRQCGEQAFSRHRDTWMDALLLLTRAAAITDSTAVSAVRIAAADALVHMTASAVGWAAQRRDLNAMTSRLAVSLVPMAAEPAMQHGAMLALVALTQCSPHSLQARREFLASVAAPVAVGTTLSTAAAAAAAILGALPCCLAANACGDAWLSHVERLSAGLQEAMCFGVGSICDRPSLRYSLPPSYAPFGAAVPLPPLPGSPAEDRAAQCARLLGATLCTVRALHSALSPIILPPEGCMLSVPLDMIVELVVHGLAVDAAPPFVGALPHPPLLLALPELHTMLLQLLHSTLTVGRNLLSHLPAIADSLRLVWTRTGRGGPPHFQCPGLRAAAYSLTAALLVVLGPCASLPLAEALVLAVCTDLDPVPEASCPEVSPLPTAAEVYDSAQRKRARLGPSPPAVFASGLGALPAAVPTDRGVCRSGVRALHGLLFTSSELLALPLLASAQESLLRAIDSRPQKTLLAPLISALHAAVVMGRAASAATIPRAIAAFRAAARAGVPAAHAASYKALHSVDGLLHLDALPRSEGPWAQEHQRHAEAQALPGQPAASRAERAATARATAIAPALLVPLGAGSACGLLCAQLPRFQGCLRPAGAPLASAAPAPAPGPHDLSASPPAPSPAVLAVSDALRLRPACSLPPSARCDRQPAAAVTPGLLKVAPALPKRAVPSPRGLGGSRCGDCEGSGSDVDIVDVGPDSASV